MAAALRSVRTGAMPDDALEFATPTVSQRSEGGVYRGPLHRGVDVAAVQADDQRQVRAGQLGPVTRAAGDEARLLIAELVLQAPRDGLHLAPQGGRVEGPAQWQEFT